MENRLISMKDESESVGNLKRKTKKNMESITHFDLLNSPNYESDHHSRLNYLNNYRTDCCFILCRNFKLLQDEAYKSGDDPTLIQCQVVESCKMSEYLFFKALNW